MKYKKNIRLHPSLYKRGWFFVTIVSRLRRHIFSGTGKATAEKALAETGRRLPGWKIDTVIIMPDHVHFIVYSEKEGVASLSDFVRVYKSLTALGFRKENGLTGSIWQRGYYDHIIRSEKALYHIRIYILANPDKENIDWPKILDEVDSKYT